MYWYKQFIQMGDASEITCRQFRMRKKHQSFQKVLWKQLNDNVREIDVESVKQLHDSHNDLPFLPERMKISKCPNLYAICIRTVKQGLNHGLMFKKIHRMIKFNQKA